VDSVLCFGTIYRLDSELSIHLFNNRRQIHFLTLSSRLRRQILVVVVVVVSEIYWRSSEMFG